MRLHFRAKPWDLYAGVGYTFVMAAILLAFGEGNLLAILLVLFMPGYVLVAALFPGGILPEKPEIDWIERIALSFGLSIAVIPLLGLLVNFTPWGMEFYILGPGGNASGYPTALNVSQNGSVIIGIANHEASTANYTVRVDLVGVRVVYNATAGFKETVEVNRTTWTWLNVTVADGANWTQPYIFSIPSVGLWKVQFLLLKDDDFSSAYRELHLYVRVA